MSRERISAQKREAGGGLALVCGPGLRPVEEGKAAGRTCPSSQVRGRDEEPGDLA